MLLIVGVGERIIATVRRMIELTELDKEVELLVIDLSRTQLGSATNGPCDTRLFVFGFKSFKIY